MDERDDYADPPGIDAPPGPGGELVCLIVFVTGCITGLAWIVYGLTN